MDKWRRVDKGEKKKKKKKEEEDERERVQSRKERVPMSAPKFSHRASSFERRAFLSLLSHTLPFLLLRRNVVFLSPPSFPSERRLDSFLLLLLSSLR